MVVEAVADQKASAAVGVASVPRGSTGVVAEVVVVHRGDQVVEDQGAGDQGAGDQVAGDHGAVDHGATVVVLQGGREGVLEDRVAYQILAAVAVVFAQTAVVVEAVAACRAVEGMAGASRGDPSEKVVEVASGLVVAAPLVEAASCQMAAGALVAVVEACPWRAVAVGAVHRAGMVASVGTAAAWEAYHQASVVVVAGWATAAMANPRAEVQVALRPRPREEEPDQPQVAVGEAHPQGVHRQTAGGVGPSGPGGSEPPADALLLIHAARPWSPS